MCITFYRNIDSEPPTLWVNLLKLLGCCAKTRSVGSSCWIEGVGGSVGESMQEQDKNHSSWDRQLEQSERPGVYEEAEMLDTSQRTDYETSVNRNLSY